MDNTTIDSHEYRFEIWKRLEAAQQHVMQAPLHDVAQELVVQGLDLVHRDERQSLFADAMAELDEEASGDVAI